MIGTNKQLLAVRKQRKLLDDGLRAALKERKRDDFAEAHIAHLRADIAVLDNEIRTYLYKQFASKTSTIKRYGERGGTLELVSPKKKRAQARRTKVATRSKPRSVA